MGKQWYAITYFLKKLEHTENVLPKCYLILFNGIITFYQLNFRHRALVIEPILNQFALITFKKQDHDFNIFVQFKAKQVIMGYSIS